LAEVEWAREVDRQLPVGDEIFLDHVGHLVRDQGAASRALARIGFAPTPVSIQYNLDGTKMGTGNITAMLTRGYIEVLFKVADTPLGQEFEATLAGHAGVHLANFVVADAAKHHQRLADEGFAMRPLVEFQRPVDTVDGAGSAAFTVVRLERGAMAEGRIQILTHRTEATVWQKRWLTHPNGALALIDLVIASPDVAEATARFERFLGRQAKSTQFGQTTFVLDRGQVQLFSEAAFVAMFPEVAVPRLPFIGAYAIRVQSLATVESLVKISPRRRGADRAVSTGAWRRRVGVRGERRRSALAKLRRAR
jgi:hypothetical protein